MAASLARLNSNASTHYYAKDNYYAKNEALETSSWYGQGAYLLKLKGEVSAEVFKNLMDGKSPNGKEYLGSKPRLRVIKNEESNSVSSVRLEKHRSGVDVTFAPPKSVSIAALVEGKRDVEIAHRTAVTKTLKFIEDNYSITRIGPRGKQTNAVCGNLIVARFEHDTSRSQDPQLHTHCVILSSLKSPDGQWRKLHNDVFWNNSKHINDLYIKNLEKELNKHGFKTTANGQSFELANYKKEQIQLFSKQTKKINIVKSSQKFKEAIQQELINGRNPGRSEKYVERMLKLEVRDAKLPESSREALKDSWKKDLSLIDVNNDVLKNKIITTAGTFLISNVIDQFNITKPLKQVIEGTSDIVIHSITNKSSFDKEAFQYAISNISGYVLGSIGSAYFGGIGGYCGQWLGEHFARVTLSYLDQKNNSTQENTVDKDSKNKLIERIEQQKSEKEYQSDFDRNNTKNAKEKEPFDKGQDQKQDRSLNEKSTKKDQEIDFDNWSKH